MAGMWDCIARLQDNTGTQGWKGLFMVLAG
jgi:hypothetical protein